MIIQVEGGIKQVEKRLFKRIIINFIGIGVISIVLISLVTYIKNKNEVYRDIDQMLEQVILRYEAAQQEIESKLELYETDYLNRVQAVEFMLEQNENLRTQEGIKEIKKMMGVESIYIIDYSGEIILSSEEETLGLNLLEHEEAKSIWGLIRGSDQRDYVISMDGKNILEKEPKSYISIKSRVKDYAVVQIGMKKGVITELKEESSIGQILKNTPTIYDRLICAIDATSGKMLGITVNNEQKLVFDDVHSEEELIELLKHSKQDSFAKINGKYNFFKAKQVDDIFLVLGQKANSIFQMVIMQIISITGLITTILIIAAYVFKKYFKQYFVNDLSMIENNIKDIVTGNFNVHFQSENKEFLSLVEILNKWKDAYKNKAYRMTKIVSDIGPKIAVFECLYYIQSNFFTDNMKAILEVDDVKWKQIESKPEAFEKYIKSLLRQEDTNGLIYINNKFLQIKCYSVEQEFYGIIIDRTEEIQDKEQTATRLKEAEEAAERDYLTNLLNRIGFEKRVREALEQAPNEGLMILFDLDNFKQINDCLGHPEGDKVLRLVGNFLRSEFRKDDIVGRLGGDEFVVFINQSMPVKVLANKLDKLLVHIRQRLDYYYQHYNISISIGITYVNSRKKGYKDVYKYADLALYMAKKQGKDRYYINEQSECCMYTQCIQCMDQCVKENTYLKE